MTKGQTGWLLLVFAAWCLIIIGVQGSLGVTIAILFSPSEVTLTEGGNIISPSTGTSTGSTTSGG